MPRRSRRCSRLATTLCLAGAALAAVQAPARAAELGDARVLSHIGQQLVADIDLAMLEDPSAPVAVRLASPEVYSGAGIAMPSVLSSLNLSVMRREGRQYLHVTSLRPVDADHLHLYLELNDRGQRAVRLATLWLTPDPHPAPAAVPVAMPVSAPVPAAVPVVVAMAAMAPSAAPSRPSPAPAAAAGAMSGAAPVGTVSAAAPSIAPAPAAPATLPAARRPPLSPGAAVRREPTALPPEGIAPPPRLRRSVPPLAAGKPMVAPHAAHQIPSCMPATDEAQACSVLGAKNDALREQLGKLEAKVKGLQLALGVTPHTVAAPVAGAADAAGAAASSATAPVPAMPLQAGAPAAAHKPAPGAAGAGHEAGAQAATPDAATAHPAGTDAAAGSATPVQHGAARQGAAGEPASPAQAAPVAPPASKPALPKPALPKPISSIKTLVPHKPKPAPQEEGAPWGWIGGGAALLAGAAAAILAWRRHARMRKAAGLPAAAPVATADAAAAGKPGKPGLLDRLKARFARAPGKAVAPAATLSGDNAGMAETARE